MIADHNKKTPEYKGEDKISHLFSLAFSGKCQAMLNFMEEKGISPNVSLDNTRPIHYACSHGDFLTLQKLLDAGTEVNLPKSMKPLLFVAINSDKDPKMKCFKILLKHGADTNQTWFFKTLLDLILGKDDSSYRSIYQMTKLLLKHGANPETAGNNDTFTPLGQTLFSKYPNEKIARRMWTLIVDHHPRLKTLNEPTVEIVDFLHTLHETWEWRDGTGMDAAEKSVEKWARERALQRTINGNDMMASPAPKL